jgi:hypothetical protein
MEFMGGAATFKVGIDTYTIGYEGFWAPRLLIRNRDDVILSHKQSGFWSTKSEYTMEHQTYLSKIKPGHPFQSTYLLHDREVLTYFLDLTRNPSLITYEVKSSSMPEKHLILLIALGFYCTRNVAVEAVSDHLITMLVV